MNRLDNFVPFLLNRVEIAKQRGFPSFQIHHPNGDKIVVTMPSPQNGGKIHATRYVGDTSIVLVKLATTEADLRNDLVTGIVSKQAEDFRG